MDLQTARLTAREAIKHGIQPPAEVIEILSARGEWPMQAAITEKKLEDRDKLLITIAFAGALGLLLVLGMRTVRNSKG